MAMKFFQYVSKSKIELLHQQLCSNRSSISALSPKISVPGFSIELGVKNNTDKNDALFTQTSQLLDTLNEQKLVNKLSNQETLKTKYFYHDEGVWNQGVLRWRLIVPNLARTSSDIEAYCLFKTVGASLILLIGSNSNLLGYKNEASQTFDEPLSTSALLYVKLYRGMHEYVRMEEKITDVPSDIFLGNKLLEAAFSLELGVFCLSTVSRLPSKKIDTVFKIYSQYNLRRNSALLAQYDDQEKDRVEKAILKREEQRRILEEKKHMMSNEEYNARLNQIGISGIGTGIDVVNFIHKAKESNLLEFRYLHVGSPLYTAI